MKNLFSLTHTSDIHDQLKKAVRPLAGAHDLDVLLEEIGNSRYVLLGEASHGTHEYYTWRAHITRRLIQEKGFNIIAVEGDWPDCYRVNRFIKGYSDSGSSVKEVLGNFNRWPTWMWANWEMVAFIEWLRAYNSYMQAAGKVGFYGLDVYSLWESMEAILVYLSEREPSAADTVKKAMNCFEPFNVREGFSYAERSYGIPDSCRQEVEDILYTLRKKVQVYDTDPEAAFSAEQNALVTVNAEKYYKVMLTGGETTWNVRDRYMTETAERLLDFHGFDSKIVIWEHNTHIGDARATDMAKSGLVNIGQLLKEKHEKEGVYRVGFGSYKGSVIAAYAWSDPMREMKVPPARDGSWEKLLHRACGGDVFLLSKDIENFRAQIGHRAIGVVYDPDYEYGNYVPSVIPERYEAFIFLDRTKALHPLHIEIDKNQMPETYPWGV